MKNILVIAAHPDDEILGVGGTLLRHKEQGDNLAWLIITDIFEKDGFSATKVEKRKKEIERVSNILNMVVFNLGYSTMKLHSSDLIDMVPKIADVFNKFKPERIYVMNRSDAHSDHRVVFDAVMACSKSFRYPFIRDILMYECLSETEFAPALSEKAFIPNVWIDITKYMQGKIDLMNVYQSEIGNHPFPRSERNIKALGTYRGAASGCEYAEAFQLLKMLSIENL